MPRTEPPQYKYTDYVPDADGYHPLWGVPASTNTALTRRQAYLFHSIFMAVQRVARAGLGHGEQLVALSKLSHQYRAAMQEDMLTLRRMQAACTSSIEEKRLEEQRTERAVQEAIWHLVEILMLEDHSAIGPVFVRWVAHHCPQPSVSKVQAMETHRMHHAPEFWVVVKNLLCTGQTIEAARLLDTLICQFEKEIQDDVRVNEEDRAEDLGAFTNLRVLLETKPSLLRSDPQQFRMQFDKWQADCDECREYCIRIFDKRCAFPLIEIVNLICGDEKTLKDNNKTWYELVAAYVEFVCPEITRYRLTDLAIKCMCEQFRIDDGPGRDDVLLDTSAISNLDKIFYMVMTGRVLELMQACDQLFPEALGAHLADLLQHRGLVSHDTISSLDVDIREYFILRYATTLAAQEEYWSVALDYFAQCRVQGADHMAALIEHTDFSDESKADRVFAHLEALAASGLHQLSTQDLQKLQHVVLKAHETMGRTKTADQQYIPGIIHFLKGRNYADLQRLAEELVEGFTRSFLNDFSAAASTTASTRSFARAMMTDSQYQAVLNTLSQLVEDGELQFPTDGGHAVETLLSLHKLWKVHQMVARREFTLAAKQLMELMENNALPRRLWVLLLVHAVPLCEQHAFSTPQVYQLMARLEELMMSYKSSEYCKGLSERMLGTIRLALVNNLRSAILTTASVPVR